MPQPLRDDADRLGGGQAIRAGVQPYGRRKSGFIHDNGAAIRSVP
jgi:hypothetical protein